MARIHADLVDGCVMNCPMLPSRHPRSSMRDKRHLDYADQSELGQCRSKRALSRHVLVRQRYDLSTAEGPAFSSIAAMMAAWTSFSCAATAAVSDNSRCRVS